MTICPKCNADNRPEAAFCARCGTILLHQPAVKPAPEEPERVKPFVSEPAPEPQVPAAAPAKPAPAIPAEQPVDRKGLTPRPEGSVFGGRFTCKSLISEGEHEVQYLVTEDCGTPTPCVRICSNPECRTVHIPLGEEGENFCTICGKALAEDPPDLLLFESDLDQYGDQVEVIGLHLLHPNIHSPVASFQEGMSDGMHYCLVTPFSQEVPAQPELQQVLEWGIQLANGLDYLQSNAIAFGEELHPSSFGLVDGKIVWRNFTSARVLPMLADREKINNVRLLALGLYSWITGKTSYSPDPPLNPNLNRLFHQALMGEGFTSGFEFAQHIELALHSGISPYNLDYQVGRRTHPGREREINEDSLLCLAVSTVQRGLSQSKGIFALADGMGGHATGDLASSLAIQAITHKVSAELTSLDNQSPDEYTSWLLQVVTAANSAVYEARQQAGNDMGSTLICAFLLGNRAWLAHLGDSRIYLIREGSFQQLTTDHSVVQQLVAIGKIKPEEARTHPQRNVIYRSLGEKPQVEADILIQDLLPGDRLLICSDGLHGMVNENKIQVLIQESPSPQAACEYLVDAANLAGGEDNISAILIEVISV